MTRITAALVAAVALAVPLTATTPASATGTVAPLGTTCGFSTFTDPGVPEYSNGTVDAEIVLTDPDDPTAVISGSVTCTLQYERAHGTTANDAASVTGPVTPGVVAVAGTVTYPDYVNESLYLCTQVDVVGGPTLYAHYATVTGSATWSTSPDSYCQLALAAPAPDPNPIDALFIDYVDPIVCPVLAVVFPPEGDVPLVWNCPPY